MNKDVIVAICLIVVLLIVFFWFNNNVDNKSENFYQKSENIFEPENAFDISVNNSMGNENEGDVFHDEHLEKDIEIPDKKAQIIVFLSKNCPHCVHYDKKYFLRLKGKLNKLGKGNIMVKKVYPDKDPNNLFDKYDIQFVPAGVAIYNDKSEKINGVITPTNSLKTINSLK
jgi:hypothetical protein